MQQILTILGVAHWKHGTKQKSDYGLWLYIINALVDPVIIRNSRRIKLLRQYSVKVKYKTEVKSDKPNQLRVVK